MPLCPDGPLAKRNNQKYFSILSECSRRMIEIQNVLKKVIWWLIWFSSIVEGHVLMWLVKGLSP